MTTATPSTSFIVWIPFAIKTNRFKGVAINVDDDMLFAGGAYSSIELAEKACRPTRHTTYRFVRYRLSSTGSKTHVWVYAPNFAHFVSVTNIPEDLQAQSVDAPECFGMLVFMGVQRDGPFDTNKHMYALDAPRGDDSDGSTDEEEIEVEIY